MNRDEGFQKRKECQRKRRVWTFLLILSVFTAAFRGTKTAADENSGYETVRIGYYQSRNFQEGDGETSMRSGYAYEYIQKIASYTGWKYEYVPGTWDELYEQLTDGTIDMLAGVSWSKDREQKILYPTYEMLKETFYIYKDCDDASMQSGNISSFEGKRIGIVDEAKVSACLNQWISRNHAGITVVTYPDIISCADDFNNRRIDGFVGADNAVFSYSGITPAEMIGKEPYYLCVTGGRQDLLAELNAALSVMNEQDALYVDTLRNKYTADTSISVFISSQEKAWMENHPQITVGYLDNYLPYSAKDSEDAVTGLVKDIVPDIFAALPGDYKPEITYLGFKDQQDMIDELKNGTLDLIFPIGGEMQYAEMMGYQQSSAVMSVSADLLYIGNYTKRTVAKIAVNRNNQLQLHFTEANYPDAEIVYYDTIEDCVEAIKSGEVGGSVINAFRLSKLIGDDSRLKILPLEKTDEICFGVRFGNAPLLRVLNHGISILGEGYGTNYAYQYIGTLVGYTADDFIREHLWIAYVLIGIVLAAAVCLAIARYRHVRMEAQKEAEQNHILEEALKRAQQANYAKQVFLSNMSHDIRTPLNAILGMIEINAKSSDSDVIKENRRKAKAAVYQLLDLVGKVIEMSKLGEGENSNTAEETDLAAVVKEVKGMIMQQAAGVGVRFAYRTVGDQKQWPLVYGNAIHISEVLQHVLENAVKYNLPGGLVEWTDEVRICPDHRVMYQCTVSDTGIGMKTEFLQHIYEPFSQEAMDARTVYKGTGLGMAIVKTLVDQMNGSIEIESTPGHGTRVFIRLSFREVLKKESPEKQTVLKENPETALPAEPSDIAGMKVLLVEDNEVNIEVAKFLLEEEGVQVTVARDGKQAVERYLNTPEGTFDAILMDIMMPVMNGYEAAKEIRSADRDDAKQVPVIAVTACVSEESRIACEDAGMDEFLEKPFEMKRLKEKLQKVKRQANR